MQSRRGNLVIVISSVFFASMAVLARHLSKDVPSAQLSFLRFVIGAVMMGAWFVLRRRGPQVHRPGLLFLRGLFGSAAVLTYFVAIQRLGSGPATVLNYCSPIYAALFASLFLRERPTGAMRLGLGIATVGAILVSVATGEFATPTNPGLGGLAGLASGILGGAAITVVRSLRSNTSTPTDSPTVFFAFSAVGLVVSAPFVAQRWVPLDGALLPLCVLMGVLSVGGQLLFTYGMGFTSATQGSAITQLVPVLAWVLGVGLLSEPIVPLSAFGALLCISGVVFGALRLPSAEPAVPRTP